MKNVYELITMKRRSAAAAVAFTLIVTLTFGPAIRTAAVTKTSGKISRLTEEQKITHLLNRLGYGPRPGDIERVKQIGIEKFIDLQLHPQWLDDAATETRLADLDSLRMTIAEVYEKYPQPQLVARRINARPFQADPRARQANQNQIGDQANSRNSDQNQMSQNQMRPPANLGGRLGDKDFVRKLAAYYDEHGARNSMALLHELQAQRLIRAVYSERQLQEVMTEFWFNHFNVYWPKGVAQMTTTDYEMRAIRPNTLGKFKDLVLATAKSPAMLFFLDNFLSASPASKMPAEMANDAPEFVINQLRQRKFGVNENYARELMELHTLGVDGGYTQKDVQEVARCFTGWTLQQSLQSSTFVFREWMHDDGEKTVLGHKIPAGGGVKDGEMVIDILAHHPSAAKFIATKLARRFVSDNPPRSLIDRVAATYTKTDGDIREMLRTLFTSPEFFSPQVYRAKIKSPFELVASAIRALDGDTNGSPRVSQYFAKMGQPLYRYQAPTGFPDRADQWINTGALVERLNFALALSSNSLPGTKVDLNRVMAVGNKAQADQWLNRAIALLLNGAISPQTRMILARRLKAGVTVKGEMSGDSATVMSRGQAMENDEMMTEAQKLSRPEGVAGLQAQFQAAILNGGDLPFGRRSWRGEDNAPQPSVDLQLAQIVGLVIGSPEFQRR